MFSEIEKTIILIKSTIVSKEQKGFSSETSSLFPKDKRETPVFLHTITKNQMSKAYVCIYILMRWLIVSLDSMDLRL